VSFARRAARSYTRITHPYRMHRTFRSERPSLIRPWDDSRHAEARRNIGRVFLRGVRYGAQKLHLKAASDGFETIPLPWG